MKNTILISIILAAAQGFAVAAESSGKTEAPIGATATLSDGSVIKGTLQSRALPAESDLLGDITLDLLKVMSIDAASPLGEAPIQRRVTFRNGDRLTVRFPEDLKEIPFNTVFERVNLPLASVSKLAISGDTAGSLLYHCTFDNEQAIAAPAVGPAGTFLNGEFVPGKIGNALRVHKGVSSATVHFDKGVLQPRGTIEFWAKIENERDLFGDGGDPRFFMMETAPGSETVFQFAANDGCGRGGLSIYNQGYSAASENHNLYPAAYSSVLPGETKSWHHYTLIWDENGIPGLDGRVALAAFIDGKRIPLHGDTGLAKAPHMATCFRDNPATLFFSLNPERNHGFNNKTDFLIDEFKIFAEPRCPANPF